LYKHKFSATAAKGGGFNVNMEEHASVSKIEGFALNLAGYDIVNVAQKVDVNISGQGNVSVSAATDIFPSATLSVNGATIMQHDQPSFKGNFKSKGSQPSDAEDNGMGGVAPPQPGYKPAQWYKRL